MSIIYRCRLCLKSSRNKIDVFKDDFPKMIEILTGLKLDPFEDFPKTSCLDCAKNVKIALKTRKQIIQSHKLLLEEFLAKCRETNIFDCEINKRGSSLVENVSKDVANTTIEPKNNLETTGPIRKVLKRRLRSTNIEETKIETNNTGTTRTLKEENTRDPSKDSTPKVEVLNNVDIMETLIMSYAQEDSNSSNPPSPMSDPASDVDWIPEKGEEKERNESIKQERKSATKLPPKASDGVFFVKKRNTKARKPKSPETVVRIKKKPKGRVPPRRVTCDICKREVQSYWLQKHMETHQYNPVTCEFCGLVSKSATALRHHVFYYHRSAADEYMCDQCARSFRSKYRLNLHKKKEHGGTKDFECTTCGKKFFERMHLKRHVDKTHKNIRPYVCDFCGKSFKSKNHIKIHERIHSKEAPYNCHMCGESFKMKLTLRTHLKGVHNVHEEQKVFCDICKRGFASDIALKAHLNSRIHETEKCQYCSEMFTREYMINHLRDVHHVGGEAL